MSYVDLLKSYQLDGFWQFLEQLVAAHPIIVDRPRHSTHPRYPTMTYPLDYGYLEGTITVDGGGIDLWVGSQENRRLDAVVLTVDLEKEDVEIKLLLGCSAPEKLVVMEFLNGERMRALLVTR
jgi:inorganic pyrophosphatase